MIEASVHNCTIWPSTFNVGRLLALAATALGSRRKSRGTPRASERPVLAVLVSRLQASQIGGGAP